MAYAIAQDLVAAGWEDDLVALTSTDGGATYDATRIDAAIAHASGIIDNYLRRRYSLPLAAAPEAVKTWAMDIALYRLHRDPVPDDIARRYKDAMAQLADIAAGRSMLDVPASGASSSNPVWYAPDRLFTDVSLEGHAP